MTKVSIRSHRTKSSTFTIHINTRSGCVTDKSQRQRKIVPQAPIEQVCSQEQEQTKTDTTTSHHHRRRRSKVTPSYWYKTMISLITLLICIVIAIILLIILFRKPAPIVRTAVLRWKTTAITIAGITGSSGNRSDQLNTPYSARLDYANSLYVADRNNHRIQKFPMDVSNAITVAGNGILGSAMNQLQYPTYAIADWNDNIRVVDTFNHRIQLWERGATVGSTIAGTGILGNSSNQLAEPYAIEYNITTRILYVSDYGNCRVMQYMPGATSGTVVAGGNRCGKNTTQLNMPLGIQLDSFSNSFIIANQYAHNIIQWPMNASSWTLIGGDINGNPGRNSTTLLYIRDIKLDPMGNVYAADKDNYRIQLFMNGKKEVITIAGISGISGSNVTLLGSPRTIELDNQLNLYVADSANHRVQKFMRY